MRGHRAGGSRLYRGGKISEARFRAILRCFAQDLTATEAAAETGLSLNSTAALYRKLRAYFMEAKLFLRQDLATGVAAIDELADPEFARAVQAFHDNRMRRQRGVRAGSDQADARMAESWWRYDFAMMLRERPSDTVYDMMVAHMLAVIRACGPVGTRPVVTEASARLLAEFIDQKIRWFQRNAPGFSAPDLRASLADSLDDRPE